MTTKLQAISGAILISLLLALPLVSFAQGRGDTRDTEVAPAAAETGIEGAVENIGGIVNSLIPLLLTIAVVIFLWGLLKYLFKIGGEEGSKGGLQIMLWGVVAIFVMVSIWGLVSLLQTTLGVGSQSGATVANPANLQVEP